MVHNCEVLPLTWTPELEARVAKRTEVGLVLDPSTVHLPGEHLMTPNAAMRARIVLSQILDPQVVTLRRAPARA